MGWTDYPPKEKLQALREIFPHDQITVIHNTGFPRDHVFIQIG